MSPIFDRRCCVFCSKYSDIMLPILSSVFQGNISVCSAASCNIKLETKGTHPSVPTGDSVVFQRLDWL